MTENISNKVNILISLIAQDREEIRIIKNNIFNIVIMIVSLSFAITTYFINKDRIKCICCVDALIIVFIILFVFIRYIDLRNVRRCLKMRQDMLINVENGNTKCFRPFKASKKYPIDIKDYDIFYKISIGILLIIVKNGVIFILPLYLK